MQRPVNRVAVLCAAPPRTEPMVKRIKENNNRGFLPNTCEKATNMGCHIVEVRRKEVPAQKASIAFPFKASEIVYMSGSVRREFEQEKSLKELTGRATGIVVASSAQARLTLSIEIHAAIYLFPGLKANTTTGRSSASAVIVADGAMPAGLDFV